MKGFEVPFFRTIELRTGKSGLQKRSWIDLRTNVVEFTCKGEGRKLSVGAGVGTTVPKSSGGGRTNSVVVVVGVVGCVPFSLLGGGSRRIPDLSL